MALDSRRAVFGVCILLSALPLGGTRTASAETPITLEAAVRRAVERNLDLRAEAFTPALSETDVKRALAIYDPKLTALLDHQESVDSGSSSLSGSNGGLRSETSDANVALDQLLPTGATLSGTFTNLWSRTSPNVSSLNFDRPKLALSVNQPLLQGFGREVTERDILSAGYAKQSALEGWRFSAINTAATARDHYFALFKARESLDTRRASLAVARRIHEENQGRVRAGVLASVQLLDSELGVAQREFDLLEAERAVKDQSDQLRVFLQLPDGQELVPVGGFPGEVPSHELADALQAASEKRPDLAQARILIRAAEFKERVSRNLLLPSVSFIGEAGLAGMGSDYGSAIEDTAAGNNPFWSVGLSLSYPIGNDAARADLAASRLRMGQIRVQYRSLESTAALDVRSALRSLDSRSRQVEVAERGVQVGETRLASFIKRLAVGLTTTKDILQAEADLTTARESLAAARADRAGALTQLWKSTGELLDRHGIRISDSEIPRIAWEELQ